MLKAFELILAANRSDSGLDRQIERANG